MNSIQAKARRAGALYFLFLIVGLVDMFAFSGFVVPGDAAATAGNILAAEQLFRIGILTDFVALLIFIPVVVSLYNLLESVDRWHARLMLLLVSAGVALGFANLLTKIAPLVFLSGAEYLAAFTKPQLDALALGFLTVNTGGNAVDTAFWGLWLFPFGILVIKSRYFPRVLGILLVIAGLALLTTGVTTLVLPAYERVVSRVMMPLSLGELPIIFWLLIKGAKAPQGPAAAPHSG